MAKKYVNGVLMDTTAEENNQIKIDAENYQKQLSDYEAEKTATETKKASGKQKLKDLGLDDDEIKALMGA
jgi:regulator of replication initiation timing|tara:strand:- start:152 stop:361 length:210 start_codon:yes stop_codon:yes gene_type:complete